jgi:tRNA-Thr(GGU) m(6)t(6)A37 methyltransferase TsaA
MADGWTVRPVGVVRSDLTDLADAPRQADEDAPPARLVFDDAVAQALDGITAGTAVVVLTWLDRADRTALTTVPRNEPSRGVAGVFATRAPHRPNPIGLHTVTVTAVDGPVLTVDALEALDGTPVLDVKIALGPVEQR